MGFAHFAVSDSGVSGSIRRRTGEPILDVTRIDGARTTRSRSAAPATQSIERRVARRHARRHDALERQAVRPADSPRATKRRRSSPSRTIALWPGAVSDSQYAITEDTLVFMTTRDGAKLASYIARPVGYGPFGVVLQRTPYTRILHPAGRYWASRGYIFVAQHVRGRDVSDGKDFGDYDTDVRDGYDAVEWAARLPGANGRVGLIGHSDEGRLAWYAAVSAPPHLAALAPSAATGDPWRIVPYEDMVFSPINVAWACLMRARTLQDIGDLDIGVGAHAPAAERPSAAAGLRTTCRSGIAGSRIRRSTRTGAPHAVTTNIAKVRAPVLQISGWYDDSRGPIDYTNALTKVPGHPFIRLVMGPGAHKGVDYVAGEFGPQSRVDTRRLQLRWFDHYLLGKDNGVDREPPVDMFVFGDNTWRKEAAWPLARAVPTKWYLTSIRRQREYERGRRRCSTRCPPNAARAASTPFTYDPANPTPYLIDSRELETSLNEDFTALNASRRDALVFTSEAAHEANRGDRPDVGHALGGDRREGHRLERHAARRLPRRPRRARAGWRRAGAIPEGVRQGGAAHAGERRAIRHRPLVHVARVRAGAPASA